MDTERLDMAAKMLQKAVEESGSQSGTAYDYSPNKISNPEHGKFLNKVFKDISEDPKAKKYLEMRRLELFEDTFQNNLKKAYESKSLGRAVDDDYAASIRKLLTEQVEQGVFNTAKKPAGIASKVINTASGVAKQALKAGMKAAGPVGAALTAGELGGALAELRELGAEKIAAKNEAKQGYSSEERLKLKEMLKKLKGNPALRE